ncbi:outer membrane protein assembly factor BamD [Psychrosphaera saromensis]|uniref:Outer membrane protein assembly factor BamD n=1 Tax=Psychrosphaera saromensis TaxID=716813 RepID=A0A2S7UX44_9GAMM|nr:outer membrane protein assembly factor BamD [Psychrosphaera saromensis]PQJ53841.1 outer membrane protein assembly factor BamD [Psychrosphaera saromensis]GHB61994.1 outer membrane protein assembly factor BamD [Psychrosphaera saromensis]GLQ15366.1 outer membrane protein assembly factor BamD [Psychrosphaera saromensis]
MFKFNTLRQLSLLTVLSVSLVACTSSPEEDLERVPDNSPKARYVEAKKSLNDGMYNRAIIMLSDLETRYPFGPLSRQIQLDLMFAYYKSGKFAEALPSIDRFINLNPNHPQLDYVIYMRGLVNMETGLNGFQDFFGIESDDKDMVASRDAFNDFNKLVDTYPDSKYIPDAKKRMMFLLDKLAHHEIVIAEYYMRRSAYVAALNRCKYVLEYYQQSTSVKDALTIMIEAYDNLGLPEMKADAELTLQKNM